MSYTYCLKHFRQQLALLLGSCALVSLMSGSALAEMIPIQADTVAYGGNGCTAGSLDIKAGLALVLNFKTWSVSEQGVARATCNMTIPVSVPNGKQVGFPKGIFRGSAEGGKGVFSMEYFFAGSSGDNQKLDVGTGKFKFKAKSSDWAPCGTSVNVRINAALLMRKGSGSVSRLTLGKIPMRSCP